MRQSVGARSDAQRPAAERHPRMCLAAIQCNTEQWNLRVRDLSCQSIRVFAVPEISRLEDPLLAELTAEQQPTRRTHSMANSKVRRCVMCDV